MSRYDIVLDRVPIAKWGETVMLHEEVIMNRQMALTLRKKPQWFPRSAWRWIMRRLISVEIENQTW